MRKLGSRGVLRLVNEVSPDVVVSVYPTTTEVLGGLRRSGRLDVPVVAAITDLAMMHYWAAPGIDLHLITHPESAAEVQQVAGNDTRRARGARADASRVRRAARSVGGARALGLPARGRSSSSRAEAGASATFARPSTRRSRVEEVAIVAVLAGATTSFATAAAPLRGRAALSASSASPTR